MTSIVAVKRTLLFISVMVIATFIPVSNAAPPYYIGNRQVPGPLPPNFWTMPALDTQIGVIYGRAGTVNLLLDFAKPQLCRTQKVPLVVYVHGGWWVGGSRTGAINGGIARAFYQCGIAFASIDYRLTPAYKYKDIIGDCKLAIRFLRANADAFGIDPEKIAIWGGSAGGHLVSLMGTAGDNDGLEGPGYPGVSSRPSAVANDCGIQDLTAPWSTTSNTIIGWFLGCPPATCPDKAKEASPAWQASSDDPPILTLHGDHDPTVAYSQALALNKSLKNVGNKGAFVCVVNGNHGFGPYTAGVTVTPNGTRQAYLRFYHLIRYIEPGVFCDLNVDGQINANDSNELNNLLGIYGINNGGLPTTPLWNSQADIYSDGRIDYKDWQTFSKKSYLPPKFTIEIIPESAVIGSKDSTWFKVEIKNLGQLDIRNYTVTFNYPNGLVFKNASDNVTDAGQSIIFTDSLLPAYQSKTLSLYFKLSDALKVPETGITFDVKTTLTSILDTLPIDNSAAIGVPSLKMNLSASMMKVQAGDKPVLNVVAFNKSPYPVTNAKVWVDLPRGLEFVSSQPQGTKTGNKIVFDIGKINSGSSEFFKVTTTVAKDAQPGSYIVNSGLSSDQTYGIVDSSVLTVWQNIPGTVPQINASWLGIDTKTSQGKANEQIKVTVSVTEGTSPYQVWIDWGNGTKASANLDGNEAVAFENAYQSTGSYEVTIKCLDSASRSKITRRTIKVE